MKRFFRLYAKFINDANASDDKLNNEHPGSGFGGLEPVMVICFGWIFALYFVITDPEAGKEEPPKGEG